MSDISANCGTWSAGEAQAGQGTRDSRQLVGSGNIYFLIANCLAV